MYLEAVEVISPCELDKIINRKRRVFRVKVDRETSFFGRKDRFDATVPSQERTSIIDIRIQNLPQLCFGFRIVWKNLIQSSFQSLFYPTWSRWNVAL